MISTENYEQARKRDAALHRRGQYRLERGDRLHCDTCKITIPITVGGSQDYGHYCRGVVGHPWKELVKPWT